MTLRRAMLVGLVAVAAGTGVAACGDDEEGAEASTSTALTETELASEAQAICAEHNKAIDAGFEEEGVKGAPTPVEVRALVKDYVLPQYSAWIGRQEALEPPEDLAADWETWVTDSTAARDAIKDDPNVAFDPSQFETVNSEADSLGLGEECYAGPTA